MTIFLNIPKSIAIQQNNAELTIRIIAYKWLGTWAEVLPKRQRTLDNKKTTNNNLEDILKTVYKHKIWQLLVRKSISIVVEFNNIVRQKDLYSSLQSLVLKGSA